MQESNFMKKQFSAVKAYFSPTSTDLDTQKKLKEKRVIILNMFLWFIAGMLVYQKDYLFAVFIIFLSIVSIIIDWYHKLITVLVNILNKQNEDLKVQQEQNLFLINLLKSKIQFKYPVENENTVN